MLKFQKHVLLRPGEIKASEDIWNKWFSLSWSSVAILQQNYYPSCYNRQSYQRLAGMRHKGGCDIFMELQAELSNLHTSGLFCISFFHSYTLEISQFVECAAHSWWPIPAVSDQLSVLADYSDIILITITVISYFHTESAALTSSMHFHFPAKTFLSLPPQNITNELQSKLNERNGIFNPYRTYQLLLLNPRLIFCLSLLGRWQRNILTSPQTVVPVEKLGGNVHKLRGKKKIKIQEKKKKGTTAETTSASIQECKYFWIAFF